MRHLLFSERAMRDRAIDMGGSGDPDVVHLATDLITLLDRVEQERAAPAAPTILQAEFEGDVIEMLEQAMVGADTHHRALIARHLAHHFQGRTLPTGIDRPGATPGRKKDSDA